MNVCVNDGAASLTQSAINGAAAHLLKARKVGAEVQLGALGAQVCVCTDVDKHLVGKDSLDLAVNIHETTLLPFFSTLKHPSWGAHRCNWSMRSATGRASAHR